MPSNDEEKLERIIIAATAAEGDPTINLEDPSDNPENVQRVIRIFT